MRKQQNNKGFTLVEVICAVTIMMLVVVPIFTGFLMAAKTNASYGDKLEINMMLENELESIKATGKFRGYAQTVESFDYSKLYDIELTAAGVKRDQEENQTTETLTPDESKVYKFVTENKKIEISLKQKVHESKVAYYVVTLIYDPDPLVDDDNVTLEGGVYAPW